MGLVQLRLLDDPDERLLDDYYGITYGWIAWTLWDSGFGFWLGFNFGIWKRSCVILFVFGSLWLYYLRGFR